MKISFDNIEKTMLKYTCDRVLAFGVRDRFSLSFGRKQVD